MYVVSTLSAPVTYPGYIQTADLPKVAHSVTIAGGANIADKRLVTPRGVVTRVSEEDMEVLKKSEVFLMHVKNGYIDILEKDPKEVENVAADMNTRDESAPLVPEDYVDAPEGTAKPMVGKPNGRK